MDQPGDGGARNSLPGHGNGGPSNEHHSDGHHTQDPDFHQPELVVKDNKPGCFMRMLGSCCKVDDTLPEFSGKRKSQSSARNIHLRELQPVSSARDGLGGRPQEYTVKVVGSPADKRAENYHSQREMIRKRSSAGNIQVNDQLRQRRPSARQRSEREMNIAMAHMRGGRGSFREDGSSPRVAGSQIGGSGRNSSRNLSRYQESQIGGSGRNSSRRSQSGGARRAPSQVGSGRQRMDSTGSGRARAPSQVGNGRQRMDSGYSSGGGPRTVTRRTSSQRRMSHLHVASGRNTRYDDEEADELGI